MLIARHSRATAYSRQLTIGLAVSAFSVSFALILLLLFWHPPNAQTHSHVYWAIMAAAGLLSLMLLLALERTLRSRAMLKSMERSFLSLVSTTTDMVLISDMQGRLLDVNALTVSLLGFDRINLLSKALKEINPEHILHTQPKLRLALERGETLHYESYFHCANGQWLAVESRICKGYWLEAPCYIEIVHDISARKNAEAALHAAKAATEQARNQLETRMAERTRELQHRVEERDQAQRKAADLALMLSDMIDCMPSIIITVDVGHRVQHWNKAAHQLTGISAKQATGKSLKALLPQFDEQIDSVAIATNFGRRPHTDRIQLLMHKRPTLFDVLVYPLSGRGRGVVIRVDDVTEKTRIEQTLVQTEKMLSLGGLAAGMAHEINNPLGAILQSTQNIERRLSGQWPRNLDIAKRLDLDMEKLQAYLDKQRIPAFLHGIREAGERAASIVTDMLSFSRQSSGDLQLVTVNSALDSAIRLASADYNQKAKFDFRRIQISRDYDSDLPRVRAQKNQLEQVFLNLLINAAQALAKNEQHAPTILLRVRREHQQIIIEVQDNGPGMSEAIQRRVFEPFFTTKEEGHGTGLGLSVSYFIIVEQLKGAMEVESALGVGTCFRIKLPCAEAPVAPAIPARTQFELPL